MAVKDALLTLLLSGPRHGYQLKAEFEAATGNGWPLNVLTATAVRLGGSPMRASTPFRTGWQRRRRRLRTLVMNCL